MHPYMRVRASLLLPLAAVLAICVQRAVVQLDSAAAEAPLAAPVAEPEEPPAEVVAPRIERPKPVTHRLLFVRRDVVLRRRPGGDAAAIAGPTTEFGGARVLGVATRRGHWLGVVSEDLPNGRVAWVRSGDPAVSARRTAYLLHADLSERSVELRRGRKVLRRVSVAVGSSGSPTPPGRYAVTDKIRGDRYGPYYGCCILALTGRQANTPPGWTGGNRLAIHGTDAPSTIGSPSSAGCLRASDSDLQVLMRRVPVGTPVLIRA